MMYMYRLSGRPTRTWAPSSRAAAGWSPPEPRRALPKYTLRIHVYIYIYIYIRIYIYIYIYIYIHI